MEQKGILVSVFVYVCSSVLLWGRGIPGDVGSAVYPVRGGELLPRQRRPLWPMGFHACWIQQPGNLAGKRPPRRRRAQLQQVCAWDARKGGNQEFLKNLHAVFSRRPCSSSWLPQGNYLMSNRDECTVSLIYAIHLKKQGSVSFEYQYPDNNLLFEFFVSLLLICFSLLIILFFRLRKFCQHEQLNSLDELELITSR